MFTDYAHAGTNFSEAISLHERKEFRKQDKILQQLIKEKKELLLKKRKLELDEYLLDKSIAAQKEILGEF
jgi:hypothetical protein